MVTVKLGLGHIALAMLLFVKPSLGFDISMAILIYKQEHYQVPQFDLILVWGTLSQAFMLHLVL